jgi:hypothetical protein
MLRRQERHYAEIVEMIFIMIIQMIWTSK